MYWQFVFDFRQSVKYQSLVEDRLRHTDIAFSLCEDLYTSVQNCLELAQQIQQAGLQVESSVQIFKRTVHFFFLSRDGDCFILVAVLFFYCNNGDLESFIRDFLLDK